MNDWDAWAVLDHSSRLADIEAIVAKVRATATYSGVVFEAKGEVLVRAF